MANTLSEYYSSQGQTMPSLVERAKAYEKEGLGAASTYSGNEQQNALLLGRLTGASKQSTSPTSAPQTSGANSGDIRSGFAQSFDNAIGAGLDSLGNIPAYRGLSNVIMPAINKGADIVTNIATGLGSRAASIPAYLARGAQQFVPEGGATSENLGNFAQNQLALS